MFARAGRVLTHPSEAVLNRAIIWLSVALVLSVLGFATYYYLDRRIGGEQSLLDRQTQSIEDAVQADPNNEGARMALAATYSAAGRHTDAAEQYRSALLINDNSLAAMLGLGESLVLASRTGDSSEVDLQEAVVQFEQIIAATETADVPGTIVQGAHYYLARVMLDRGDAATAVEEAKTAISLDRADADSWYLLGEASIATGELDQAIEALGQATLFVPSFAEAYQLLIEAYDKADQPIGSQWANGMYLFSTGDIEAAAEVLEEAIVMSNEAFVPAWVGLGLVHETGGDREAAKAAYQRALLLDPENFNATSGLFRLGEGTADAPHGVPEAAQTDSPHGGLEASQ